MNYYYPSSGPVYPQGQVSNEKPGFYPGAAHGAMPSYSQHNSLPPGVAAGPGLVRPSPAALAPSLPTSMPGYCPSTIGYPSSLYAAPGALYASSSLAYAAQPHLAAQANPGAPQPGLAQNPYIAAPVPASRYPSAYTGAHIITTSAGASPYPGGSLYGPSPVSTQAAYHAQVRAPGLYHHPQAAQAGPMQAPISSYPTLSPGAPPHIRSAPAYVPGAYNRPL